MIVTGRDVGGEGAERVKWRIIAKLALLLDVHLDLMHRHVAGAFNHDLTIAGESLVGQFA